MRLCRFGYEDDMILAGFYADDHVIPVDLAAEAYSEAGGCELPVPATENLIDLLPPDGICAAAMRELAAWVEKLEETKRSHLAIPIGEVELLAPIARPAKILLLAGNYAAHLAERGEIATERRETFPYVFMKPPTTLTHPGDPIVLPALSPDFIDWECELGVVIGCECRGVAEADALNYVAGYTVINDISDRKFSPNPGRKPRDRDRFFDWMHGKWHDTFLPVGPCILSADAAGDPQAKGLRLSVNGRVKQEGSTAGMIFPVAAVISFLSEFVTLEAGDLIATGTPAGVGAATGDYLRPGDVVVATVEGIGSLENPVQAET